MDEMSKISDVGVRCATKKCYRSIFSVSVYGLERENISTKFSRGTHLSRMDRSAFANTIFDIGEIGSEFLADLPV